MNSSVYFSQLRQEFKNDPYRDRFLAELEDHAEDLAEAENLSPKSLTSHFMQKHFGEPKQIKKTFVQITRPWQKWLEVAEALGCGILSALLVFPSLVLSSLLPWHGYISELFVAFIFSYFFYLWAWNRLKPYWKNDIVSKNLSITFVFLPTSLVILVLFLRQFYFGNALSPLLALYVLSIFSGAVAFFVSEKSSKQEASSSRGNLFSNFFKQKNRFPRIFGFLFFLCISSFSIIRALDPSWLEKTSFWVFNFFSGIEFFALTVLPLITLPSIISSTYLSFILIIFFFLLSLFHMLYRHRWSWVGVGFLVYFLSLPFVNSPLPRWESAFIVPVQNISNQVEETQFGPFNGLRQNFHHDLDDAFNYSAKWENSKFLLTQTDRSNIAHQFTFNPEQYSSKTLSSSKKRIVLQNSTQEEFEPIIWPNGIKCELPQPWIDNGLSSEPTLIYPGPNDCQNLFFNERQIMKTEGYITFKQALLSSNEQWLILLVSPNSSPDSVYLLDLRSLNQNS